MRPHATFAAAALVGLLTAAGAAAQKQPDLARYKAVKEMKMSGACPTYKGVVQEIDENGLTLYGEFEDGIKINPRTFAPIDMLRKGEVIENTFPGFAYRWKDVKKGDTVHIQGTDDGAGGWFCTAISIRRRPGDTLPKSQEPKKDIWYDSHRVQNDIENGLDITEEEIWKLFPTKTFSDPDGASYTPGGLDGKYRVMLLENRKKIAEEKEKALKAKSADGKGESKKDDKK